MGVGICWTSPLNILGVDTKDDSNAIKGLINLILKQIFRTGRRQIHFRLKMTSQSEW